MERVVFMTPMELLVRRVERVALGTPYRRVVEKIREMTHASPMAGARWWWTGQGSARLWVTCCARLISGAR
ncbi:MAG TPA: hypothetical protein VG297_22165 [Bryobacteraceae bacterium]|jgi:hypothetical protein|nr:hypothetical protein [Bryobacteraceae bacterium]